MKRLCSCLAAAAALAACSGGERLNVLLPDGSPSVVVMAFRQPLALDPPPEGWCHRTFFRTAPMQIAWGWFAEQPIASDFDETVKMEIIWGNRSLRAGDWKYLSSFWSRNSFPHYVARGGDENAVRVERAP